MPNTPHSPSTALLRIVAGSVVSLSLIACGLQVIGILAQWPHLDPNTSGPALFAPPLITFIAGVAIATLLEGIAQLLAAPHHGSTDLSPVLNRLLLAISELKSTLPALIAQSVQPPADQAPPAPELPTPYLADENLEPSVQGSNVEAHLERMVKLLEEMKDVSMLDETQRQTRRKHNQERRKTSRLEEAARFINTQSWQQADAVLQLLESLHPGDPDVQACRIQLDNARISTQADVWDRLTRQVHDLLALSRYSEALTAIMQFLEQFPAHTDGQQLALRIKQEHAIYVENTSSRLYDEIKSAVENRKWRTALDGIQNFLERFPDHSRANKIRQQIRVIQKNAEIEERHEQEDRIRELINARQWAEAADMSEDLLQRFPDSPQASYLTELLPKLRERSAVGAEDALSSG
jgi:outer membrane protein assembly factor BamD (BamD/ComL family)